MTNTVLHLGYQVGKGSLDQVFADIDQGHVLLVL
jgi:hypothetical protein